MLHFNEVIAARAITFSNKLEDTGEFRMFSVTHIEQAVKRDTSGGVTDVWSGLDPSRRSMYLNDYGVEPHRLARLKPPFEPILTVFNRDQTCTVIDGAHRMAYAYLHNWELICYRIVPPTIWEKYLVDLDTFPAFMNPRDPEVQQALLTGFSGVF